MFQKGGCNMCDEFNFKPEVFKYELVVLHNGQVNAFPFLAESDFYARLTAETMIEFLEKECYHVEN